MSGRRIARWALTIAATGLIAVGLLALAGCGDDSDSGDAAGEDLTAIHCPMEKTGVVDGIDQYEPAEGAFDTADLLGMELNDARGHASDHGCEIVVSVEDGEGRPVPIEIDPTRIYLYVDDGEVTYIEGVGGGI